MARPYDESLATFRNPHNYPIVLPTPDGSNRRLESGDVLVGPKGFYVSCCAEDSIQFVGDGTPNDEAVARVLGGKPPHKFPKTDPREVSHPPQVNPEKVTQTAKSKIKDTDTVYLRGKSKAQWVAFLQKASFDQIKDKVKLNRTNLKRLIQFLGLRIRIEDHQNNRSVITEVKTQLSQMTSV